MIRGILLIALTASLWGTTGTVVKFVTTNYGLDAVNIAGWRIFMATPLLLILSSFMIKEKLLKVEKQSIKLFALYGLTMVTFQLSFFQAIDRSLVSTATLIAISSSPIFVAILSRIFLKEHLTTNVIVALSMSILGTSLIIGVGELKTSFNTDLMLGSLFALGAGLSYATYTVINKNLLKDYPPLKIIALAFLIASLLVLPGMSFPNNLPPLGWAALVYLGIVTTALPYMFFSLGLRLVTATAASIVSLLEPLVATILATFIIGEELTTMKWIGAGLLFCSLFVLSIKRKKEIQEEIKTDM